MTKEYEVKVRVSNLDIVRKSLAGLGSKLINNYVERDYYLDLRNCLPGRSKDVVFRIRIRGINSVKEGELTIKGPRVHHHGIKMRDEVNAKIERPEEILDMIEKIGIKTLQVTKVREEYVLENYRIFLDNVHELGTFIEIELQQVEDIDRAKDEVDRLLRKLGVSGELVSKSYAEMKAGLSECNE